MSTLVKKHTDPDGDTCAITRLGVTFVADGLRLEVGGMLPHGNTVTNASTFGTMPVTLRATPLALAGTPATPTTGSSIVCPPANREDVPTPIRLSISRIGEIGM